MADVVRQYEQRIGAYKAQLKVKDDFIKTLEQQLYEPCKTLQNHQLQQTMKML